MYNLKVFEYEKIADTINKTFYYMRIYKTVSENITFAEAKKLRREQYRGSNIVRMSGQTFTGRH